MTRPISLCLEIGFAGLNSPAGPILLSITNGVVREVWRLRLLLAIVSYRRFFIESRPAIPIIARHIMQKISK